MLLELEMLSRTTPTFKHDTVETRVINNCTLNRLQAEFRRVMEYFFIKVNTQNTRDGYITLNYPGIMELVFNA